MMHPMSSHEFSLRAFSYRLDVAFAQQRRDLEVQIMEQLKAAYEGHIPQALWEKQRRRVRHAQLRLGYYRAILFVFLKDTRN